MSKSFIRPLTDKQRQKINLQYQLYEITYQDKTAICIQDSSNKRFYITTQPNESLINVYSQEIQECIEGLHWILKQHSSELHSLIHVKYFSNSTYCINLLREWMDIWKEKEFETRPHQDLLKQLQLIRDVIQITPKWVNEKHNDITLELQSLLSK